MATFRSTVRAVCGAFIPASTTVWGLLLATVVVREPRALGAIGLRTALMEWLLLSIGYGVGWLWLPSRHGRRAATTRHHVLAGVLTPLILLVLLAVSHQNTAGILVLSFASGTLGALLQWVLARRVPPPSLEELELAADESLTRALGEGVDLVSVAQPARVHDQR